MPAPILDISVVGVAPNQYTTEASVEARISAGFKAIWDEIYDTGSQGWVVTLNMPTENDTWFATVASAFELNANTPTAGGAGQLREANGTLYLVIPRVTNTGPVTMRIGDNDRYEVRDSDGQSLVAGEIKGGRPIILRRSGSSTNPYYLVINQTALDAKNLLTLFADVADLKTGGAATAEAVEDLRDEVYATGSLGWVIPLTMPTEGDDWLASIPSDFAAEDVEDAPGTTFMVTPRVDNAGPVTMKVGAGPVIPVRDSDGVALVAGEVQAGRPIILRRSGSTSNPFYAVLTPSALSAKQMLALGDTLDGIATDYNGWTIPVDITTPDTDAWSGTIASEFAEVAIERQTLFAISPRTTNAGPVTLRIGTGERLRVLDGDASEFRAGEIKARRVYLFRMTLSTEAEYYYRQVGGVTAREVANLRADIDAIVDEFGSATLPARSRYGWVENLATVSGTNDLTATRFDDFAGQEAFEIGRKYLLRATATNTGEMTLTVAGEGPHPLLDATGGAMPINAIKSGGWYIVRCSGTELARSYTVIFDHIPATERRSALRTTGVIRLASVAGTSSAMTASMTADAVGVGDVTGNLYAITPASSNSSTSFTLAIDGGAALPVLDAAGDQFAISGFVSGRTYILRRYSDHYRAINSGEGGGGGGGSGTVTSVGLTGSGGITITGGAITDAGTIDVGVDAEELAETLGLDDKADAATVATALTGKQPLAANLTGIAALDMDPSELAYVGSGGVWVKAPITPQAIELLAAETSAEQRAVIGAGSGTGSGALADLDSVGTDEIDDSAVTLVKLADIATARFLGRVTADTGEVEALTVEQARTALGMGTAALADVEDLPISDDVQAELDAKQPLQDVIPVASGDYTLTLADRGKIIRFTGPAGQAPIVPPASSVDFPGGWSADVACKFAVAVQIDEDATLDDVLSDDSRTITPEPSVATLRCIADDEWTLRDGTAGSGGESVFAPGLDLDGAEGRYAVFRGGAIDVDEGDEVPFEAATKAQIVTGVGGNRFIDPATLILTMEPVDLGDLTAVDVLDCAGEGEESWAFAGTVSGDQQFVGLANAQNGVPYVFTITATADADLTFSSAFQVDKSLLGGVVAIAEGEHANIFIRRISAGAYNYTQVSAAVFGGAMLTEPVFGSLAIYPASGVAGTTFTVSDPTISGNPVPDLTLTEWRINGDVIASTALSRVQTIEGYLEAIGVVATNSEGADGPVNLSATVGRPQPLFLGSASNRNDSNSGSPTLDVAIPGDAGIQVGDDILCIQVRQTTSTASDSAIPTGFTALGSPVAHSATTFPAAYRIILSTAKVTSDMLVAGSIGVGTGNAGSAQLVFLRGVALWNHDAATVARAGANTVAFTQRSAPWPALALQIVVGARVNDNIRDIAASSGWSAPIPVPAYTVSGATGSNFSYRRVASGLSPAGSNVGDSASSSHLTSLVVFAGGPEV